MNRFLYSILIAFCICSTAHASQVITCKFTDITNTDQLVVTLTSDQSGNLVYASAGLVPSDASLAIKRGTDPSADTASFVTQVQVVQMNFKMPKAQILKTGVTFSAALTTEIDTMNSTQDQSLSCSS
jgi:hypothetical protein